VCRLHTDKCPLNLHPSVLHPALRLSWFKSIDDDSYERAKDVFTYHFHEYEASTPVSTPQPTLRPGPHSISDSFLANIARRSSSVHVTTPKPASEFDRFAIYEHGKDEVLALEHPLLWWKVCRFLTIVLFITYGSCFSPISMSSQLLHAWLVTFSQFQEQWFRWNASFRNLGIFVLINAQA
jgi:hypothetical protein